MWDDLTPFLAGAGPSATVLDPDGTPNTIIDVLLGGSIQVDWSFSGMASPLLADIQFTVTVYADPVGPGTNTVVGSPVNITGTGPAYTVTIPIAPNSLPPEVYRLTTVITTIELSAGSSLPIAGFVDGPIIQVRPGP